MRRCTIQINLGESCLAEKKPEEKEGD